jgi:chromate transporter
MICLDLFWTFFKIGLFTFGGGYAMLPLIQAEVAAHGWLSTETLLNFVAVSESTPGPFAVNIATYIGSRLAGIPGAACATLGVALPSFIIILIVARCYERFRSSKVVSGVMTGLKPAVIGLIGSAILTMGAAVLFPGGVTAAVFSTLSFWVSVGIFALTAVLAFKKVHPIALICLSAALGVAAGYLLL